MADLISHRGNVLGGALLVAGTTIGAGMLGIPLVTGLAGFLPALTLTLACWAYMVCTGLLYMEATLWLPDGANMISISKRLLGRFGEWTGGICFVFLYYCFLVAYFAGGAPVLSQVLHSAAGVVIDEWVGLSLLVVIFGAVVYLGTWVSDRLNFILMIGLVGSYVGLLGLGSGSVSLPQLQRSDWSPILLAAPILFGAFGYHNIIPTLCTYLGRDVQKMRWTIILGATLPLLIYVIWQWLAIGAIPSDALRLAHQEGVPATELFEGVTGSRWVGLMAHGFAFFALITSIIGVALSMVDFLGDGLKISRRGWGRLLLCLLVFLPPALIASLHPGLFLLALGLAGGFGEAITNGLLPILMVWRGSKKGFVVKTRCMSSRLLLSLLLLSTLVVIVVEATALLR